MHFVTKCKGSTVTVQRFHKRGFCILYPQGRVLFVFHVSHAIKRKCAIHSRGSWSAEHKSTFAYLLR